MRAVAMFANQANFPVKEHGNGIFWAL